MYMIGHQMSFLHPALLLRCQLAKHLSKVLAQGPSSFRVEFD